MSTSRFIAEPNASVPPPPAPEAEVPPATASRAASRRALSDAAFSSLASASAARPAALLLALTLLIILKERACKRGGSGGARGREQRADTFHDAATNSTPKVSIEVSALSGAARKKSNFVFRKKR